MLAIHADIIKIVVKLEWRLAAATCKEKGSYLVMRMQTCKIAHLQVLKLLNKIQE